ncbi:Hypothetical protein SMAX5B_005759 [Scophthalmus maximus]|uniref:Uncharacterized protein n=1 Tax=Scophthalmus maximus TaxID=52904 RepID=A0A2U9CR65_SCOMX|nr:Hypothetical protein SMAX5B_005759 [Scophthalmus maximus]
MEALKFVGVLLLVVFVQVIGALGTPLSGQEEDGDTWTLDNSQSHSGRQPELKITRHHGEGDTTHVTAICLDLQSKI